MKYGVVAIGRNEGDRLKQCLKSASKAEAVVYVDSGSTDGSSTWARGHDVDVIDLNMSRPFTAARARNSGFKRLQEIAPDLPYVQFVDGDCELSADWPAIVLAFIDAHPEVGAVCGRLRERHPERSIYNWLCDREWDGPAGEIRACGGNVMIRASALQAIGGYREDVVAAEDDELCVRLRGAGWRIWRLDREMGLHDAAIMRFGQWWRRAMRGGYAFAQGAYLHGAPPERHFVWESRRAWLWGIWLPLACLLAGLTLGPWGWATWLIYPLQALRQTARNPGPLRERALVATFHVLARFPEGWGQIKFMRDRVFGRRPRIIEYK